MFIHSTIESIHYSHIKSCIMTNVINYRIRTAENKVEVVSFPSLNGFPVYPLEWNANDYVNVRKGEERYLDLEYNRRNIRLNLNQRQQRRQQRLQQRLQFQLDLDLNSSEYLKDPLKLKEHRQKKTRKHYSRYVKSIKQKYANDIKSREDWLQMIIKSHETSSSEIQNKIKELTDNVRELLKISDSIEYTGDF